ncbi:hypothetical protein B0T21DRAFT_373878 [Apiosordaria backusii]|uniref:Uncharacterized protein n=1 Tax=Apiosordaria backusii TaxID=314023 RepID=A0AA40AT84_9PEZI|nr:hypothetical protein B0T21DRAFT_373878 [Apiosordaria backusii]
MSLGTDIRCGAGSWDSLAVDHSQSCSVATRSCAVEGWSELFSAQRIEAGRLGLRTLWMPNHHHHLNFDSPDHSNQPPPPARRTTTNHRPSTGERRRKQLCNGLTSAML